MSHKQPEDKEADRLRIKNEEKPKEWIESSVYVALDSWI